MNAKFQAKFWEKSLEMMFSSFTGDSAMSGAAGQIMDAIHPLSSWTMAYVINAFLLHLFLLPK